MFTSATPSVTTTVTVAAPSTAQGSADSEAAKEQGTTAVADTTNGLAGRMVFWRETPGDIDQLIEYLRDHPASTVPFRPGPVRRPLPENLPSPIEVPSEWRGEPVEFRVLATNPLEGGLAVVDLADQVVRVYTQEFNPSSWSPSAVAAFTSKGDVITASYSSPGVRVWSGGDFSKAPLLVYPSRWYEPEGVAHYISALGDGLGEKVWLLQRTPAETTLVDLVAVEDRTVVSTVELDGHYFMSGLVADGLYVVRGGDKRDDMVVTEGGVVRDAASCRDHSTEYGDLQTVGVFDHHFACLTLNGGDKLVFYSETTGRVDVVKAFGSGRWSKAFLPQIPAVNTTGYHSDQVLLLLQLPNVTKPGHVPKAVYVADLSEHTVRLVHEFEDGRHGTPLGIVDGLLIVKAGVEGENSIVVIDVASGEWHRVVDLPEGYFVYDAK